MEGSSDRLKRALDDLIYLPSLRDSGGGGAVTTPGPPMRLTSLSSPPGRDKAPEPAKCRPWDRADLMRRLQTFRAGTWFGKPAALKPAACASRGWINVGMDTLKCEFCSARLICDLPQGNTQGEQYQQLVSRYLQRLDEAHTACCPWRGNACSEWLLQFPSLGRDVLLEQYAARLQALSRVEGLPNLKPATLDRMLSVAKKGTGISKALSAASPLEAGASKAQRRSAVQRAIAACGWEVQVPGYSVGSRSSRAAGSTGAERSSSPSVSLTSPPGAQQPGGSPAALSLERVSGAGPPLESQGVVLCCPMCAARAGLWNYSLPNEAARPLWHTNLVSTPRGPTAATATPPAASGSAAGGGGGGGGSQRLPSSAPAEGAPGGFTPPPQKQPPRVVQMALSRTLGGGDLDALREASSSAPAFSSSSKGTQNAGTAARTVKVVSSSPIVPVFGSAATQTPAFGSTAPAFGSPVPPQAAAPGAGAAAEGATHISAPDSSKKRRLDSDPTPTPTPTPPTASVVHSASTAPAPAEGLDPIALHRPFCPWVNGAAGASKSGWVQVLEALSAPPAGLGGVEQPEEDVASGPPVDVYTKRFMSALFDL